MSLFGFDLANDLYAGGRHPRLIFSAGDLPDLRRRTAKGLGKRILDRHRAAAHQACEEIERSADLAADMRARDSRSIDIREDAYRLALIGLIDEDDRLLDAGRRMLIACTDDNRIDPKGYDLLYDRLSDAERKKITRVMVKDIRDRIRGRETSYYANAAHNLSFYYALGALWSLLAIRGDEHAPDLQREEDELIRRYEATLYTIVHPEGYPEEDIGYGTAAVGGQLLLGEVLRRAGLFDPYVHSAGVRNFGQAMLHFMQPWGQAVTNTGDHGSTFMNREFSLPRIAGETNDPAVRWFAGQLEDAYRCFAPDDDVDESPATERDGKGFILQASLNALFILPDLDGKKTHPARAKTPTQYVDRQRGIVSFRSGWDEDATYVTFDGSHRSPACQGHWHDSAGHFSLSALGEMFSIDTGRYNIEQDQHSVVIVDGKSGRSTDGEWRGTRYHGQLTDYQPDDLCDVAAVDNSHQSNCYWSRRWLGLVKGDAPWAFTVDDVNKDDDWHDFWWQLQTSPENTITTRKTSATITGHKHGHQLDVNLLLPPGREFPKPHTLEFLQDTQSTSSHKYVGDPHARAAAYVRPRRMAHGPCFVRPRLIAKVVGYNGRFMSVMTPRRRGDAKPKVKQIQAVPTSFAVQVDIGDYRDIAIFAYEHDLLEAGDVKGRGQWAIVRRRRDTGRLVGHTLGHGHALEVAGKKVV